ncbi:tricorn protease [Roseivirga pacifica]|uniref:Tricorn protease homolog n=1 Tax=Roseivirga pacifica TaxID=1267423 RepID=A0A1I0MW73_9BACT|nr:S41 family peptidase [Roseivirga pacifica]RKQ50757.1 tricorn protease [Roseivirga pacifica]SEV93131.1 tricorn protease [Roseivirga pacifica]
MIKSTLIGLCLVLCATLKAQQDVYFTSTPALTPDGSQIVFSFDSDLWKVSSSGGTATRLTGMDGVEEYPRISPDGKWIAFSSTQYGNADIYIMPIDGGEIKQLTFNSAGDRMETWSWDSKTIYFRSGRYNRTAAYTVDIEGRTPKRLFDHYFNWPHNLALHPDGRVFFNESWESSNQVHRKRYKGAFNPDIKTFNMHTGEYAELTDYEGKDMWSTIDKDGNVYFASDESNGQYNLYAFVNGQKTRLTNFKTSIKDPQVNANGGFVVFEKDYQVYLYDVAKKRSQKVSISIFKNNTLAQAQEFSTDRNVSAFDVSQDEKKLAFVSRGELFVSDISGKFIKQLKTKPGERVVEVKWLKDNKTLLYSQTAGGYTNLFTIDAATGTSEKQLTNDQGFDRNIELNPTLTHAAYYSGRNEVRLLDLETFKSETVANEELWGLYNPQPRFSPDGKYLTFTVRNDFEEDIYIYDIAEKSVHNYTKTGVPETSPFWGPEGKYLYFVSNRTQPSYPFGLRDGRMYRIPLVRQEGDFKSDELAKVFEEEKKEEEDKTEEKKAEGPATQIDFEADVLRAMEQIGPSFGSQSNPFVVQAGDKTQVVYSSNHDEAQRSLWVTTFEPFERPKTEKIDGSARAGEIIQVKKNLYVNNGGRISKLNLSSKKLTAIETKFDFRRSLKSEFEQIYYETWAGIEQNFYNETFHGEDWKDLKTQYAKFLPHIKSRRELRTLMNDLLGELNSSHMGFSSFGRDESTYYGSTSMNLGLMFSNDNPYEIVSVVSEGPADFPEKDIQAGDIITAINGEPVSQSTNREFYLSKPSIDEEVSLTLNRSGNSIEVKIHPNSTGSLRTNLYDEWIAHNQQEVDSKTDKKVAYIHMKNMGGGSLQDFLIEMTSEAYNRDALILDLRYNTGGNVHDEVLKFLSQKPYLQWKFREGKLTPQGNFGAGAKPTILLINEQSLSDAEMTATGFKELGLGTIIGTETYRWIIFTSGAGLVDGSFYRLPSWGTYTLDGQNIEKVGVKPDIYIRTTFEDRIKGRDPQLDRAIEEALKQLNK